MGSTGLYRPPGLTDRAFFESEFPNMLKANGRILACTTMPTSGEWSRVFYAAVRYNDDQPNAGQVFALVVLMQRAGGTFYYKEMDDTMGPAEDSCPDNILDLLTPTDSQWSNEWRERCRKYNATKAAAGKVTPGQVVTFTEPFEFTNGMKINAFRYAKDGRKVRWTALHPQGHHPMFTCKLPREWYLRTHVVTG